ncbi:MAG: NADPH-dependent F420 reductase [Actinomycetota bacterium]|nr:NADPH-dependent F420 reductase [Actinomycetota bacterium]
MPDHLESLGVVGGTGPQGRGLVARWARVGHTVYLGSRSRDKADRVASDLREVIGAEPPVRAATNEEAAERAEIVVLTFPYEAQAATLNELREAIGDKIVVNVVNPMTFDDIGPKAVPVAAGSAAEECQQLLPGARVVSAFNAVPARRLIRVDEPVDCDVPICSDDEDAGHCVAHLASRMPGVRGIDCGPLRNSRYVENLTPVLLSINRRYRIHAAIKIDGISSVEHALHAPRRSE